MSKQIKTNPAFTLDGFCGIDLRASHTQPNVAQDVQNFRLRADGSLQSRYGYRFVKDLGGAIRAIWVGILGGKATGYFLVGNRVLRFYFDTESLLSIGQVSTSTENAFFFCYEGNLYLCDGAKLYRVNAASLSGIEAYAPLIGKDWDNRNPGDPFEAKNILSNKVRISYVISDPPTGILQLKDSVQSINGVILNGTKLSSDRYYIDSEFGTVNVSGLQAGDRVTIYVTLSTTSHPQLSKLYRSASVIPFGTNTANRLLFLDWNDSSTMLCSSYVSKKDRKQAELIYSSSLPLYIPEGSVFTVGNRQNTVQSAQAYYDRLLLFTEEDTWMASGNVSAGDEFPATNISASIGCAVRNGSVSVGEQVFSIGYHGLWKWEADSTSFGEMRAECISLPIDPLLTEADYKRATLSYNHVENELWLHFPTRGDVFVYHLTNKVWYRFCGITANRFFGCNGYFGFSRESKLYLFDPSRSLDLESDGAEQTIHTEYVSPLNDFGTPDRKNVKAITLEGDFSDNCVHAALYENEEECVGCDFTASDGHTLLSTRCSSPRFRHAFLRLSCDTSKKLTLHRADVRVR